MSGAVLACAALSVVLVLFGTSAFGPGISPDSVAYLRVSEDPIALLAEFWPEQPPLYPLLLFAVPGLWLSALSLAATVTLTGAISASLSSVRSSVVLASGLVAVMAPMLHAGAYVMTEAPFVALVLAGVLALLYQRLDLAAVALSLASITRYAGLAFVFAALVWLALSGASLRRLARFAVIGLAPVALWLVRNAVLFGTLTGDRPPTRYGIIDNSILAARAIASAFVPSYWPDGMAPVWLGVAVVAALCAACLLLWRSGRSGALLPIAVTAFVAFTIVSASSGAVDTISKRLMLPAFPLLAIALTVAAGRIRRGSVTVAVALSVFAVLHAGAAASNVARWHFDGVGEYGLRVWKESETIAALISNPPGLPVYSNEPEALELRGMRARLLPKARELNNSTVATASLDSAVRLWHPSGAIVVWFDRNHRSYLYGVDSLRRVLEVHRLALYSDGAVYFVRPRGPSAAVTRSESR